MNIASETSEAGLAALWLGSDFCPRLTFDICSSKTCPIHDGVGHQVILLLSRGVDRRTDPPQKRLGIKDCDTMRPETAHEIMRAHRRQQPTAQADTTDFVRFPVVNSASGVVIGALFLATILMLDAGGIATLLTTSTASLLPAALFVAKSIAICATIVVLVAMLATNTRRGAGGQ
jgi:hypothetical protein